MAVVVAIVRLALVARGLSLACAEPIINNESNLHVFGKVSYDPRELLALYPRGSAMRTPWSGGDWAAARDSINFRWAGATTLSPVEKYALAFGQNAKKLADAVSLKTGASKNTNAQSCSQTKDCTRNSEVCAKRRGEATGFCLPDWDGISFGWSQASMLEPEPRCVAIKNGVVFEADDVKALAAQFYELNPMATIQIGRRYDGPTTQSYKAGVDPYGRFNDDSRRDVNAGAFHIAVSNLLGYHGAKIFLDVDSAEPRRLRPLLSFEVLQMKKVNYWMFPKTVDGVTSDEYMSPPRSYYFNPRGVIELMHAIINITWVEPTLGNAPRTTRSKTYEYFLELDYEGKIVGGEWLGDSNQDHPDFLAWRTTSFPNPNRVSSDGLSYSNINELITLSAECDTASETAPPPKTSSPPTPTTTKPPPMTPAPTQTLCPGMGQMSPRVVTLMASTKSPETDLWIVSPDCSVRTDTLRAVTGLDTTGTPPPFRTTREPIRQLALLTRKPVIVPPRTYLYIADDSIERVDSLPAATEHMMIKNPSTFLEGANFSSARKLVDVTFEGGSITTFSNIILPDSVLNLDILDTKVTTLSDMAWPSKLESFQFSSGVMSVLERIVLPDSLRAVQLTGISSVRGVKWPRSLTEIVTTLGKSTTEFEIRESDLPIFANLTKFSLVIEQTSCADPLARLVEILNRSVCVTSDARFEARYFSPTDLPRIEPGDSLDSSSSSSEIGEDLDQDRTDSLVAEDENVGDIADPELLGPVTNRQQPRRSVARNVTATRNATPAMQVPRNSTHSKAKASKVSTSKGVDSAEKNPDASGAGDPSGSEVSTGGSRLTTVAIASVACFIFAFVVIGFVIPSRTKNETEGSESSDFAELTDSAMMVSSQAGGGRPTESGITSAHENAPAVGYLSNDVRNDPALVKWMIPAHAICIGNSIARGGFGVIFRGVFKGRDVAIKRTLPSAWRDQAVLARFMDEIRLGAALSHDKIVQFIGISWTSLRDLSVIIEFMPGGDLRNCLRQHAHPSAADWTQPWAASKLKSKSSIALDVIEAVAYLHSMDPPILHRDLKARNVLLDKAGSAKLSDFGISRKLTVDETMTGEIGTVAWIAPEVLRGERYSERADMYSFGVLLVEMDRCNHPYAGSAGVGVSVGESESEGDGEVDHGEGAASMVVSASNNPFLNANLMLLVSSGQVRPSPSAQCPIEIRTLIDQCLRFDPKERPSARELAEQLVCL